MNDFTSHITKEYKPTLALMVYSSDSDHYIESHRVDEHGRIMAGRPLLQETLDGIVDVFFDERQNHVQFSGMIPANLLSFKVLSGGKYEMIWHRPAEIKVLQFSDSFKLDAIKIWAPAMLYKASGSSLSVWALNTSKRPTESTQLYHPPFPNVNNSGHVCLGSAKTKKGAKTYEAQIKFWEDLFWLSEFSHVNDGDKVKSGDIKQVYKRLAKSGEKWSDINELIPTKKLLKSIL